VSLACEPGTFDIESRSERDQLVKPDLVKGTAFHNDDFAKWVWLVTPRERGEHTLLVKVSAAIKDSRGLPSRAALPDNRPAAAGGHRGRTNTGMTSSSGRGQVRQIQIAAVAERRRKRAQKTDRRRRAELACRTTILVSL
jgi:hypothetical protein